MMKIKKMQDVIPDEGWDEWLHELTQFLAKYEKQVDTVTFLGRIKQKIEDCSRSYTAIWVIEMLFMTYEQNRAALGAQFDIDVKTIKASWDRLFDPVKDTRKQLICSKCIDYFYDQYAGANAVISKEDALRLPGVPSEQWSTVSKMCHDAGLHSDEDYKRFLGQLMAEMVKY
jgi:hypothetical protein